MSKRCAFYILVGILVLTGVLTCVFLGGQLAAMLGYVTLPPNWTIHSGLAAAVLGIGANLWDARYVDT